MKNHHYLLLALTALLVYLFWKKRNEAVQAAVKAGAPTNVATQVLPQTNGQYLAPVQITTVNAGLFETYGGASDPVYSQSSNSVSN